MGILGRIFLKLAGVKATNPYIELIPRADEEDLIADELFRLSLAYQAGEYGLSRDEEKAIDYCQKAAERGHVVAQLFMAQWLMKHPQDASPEVLKWLERAAMQGEKQACFNYGISVHRGDIPRMDKHKDSLPFFRKSAEFGYLPALQRMAMIYYNGEGVEANNAIAKYWAMLEYTQSPEPQDKSQSLLLNIIDEDDTTLDEKGQHIINIPKIIIEASQSGERNAIFQQALHVIPSDNKIERIQLIHEAMLKGHPVATRHTALHIMTNEAPDYEECRKLFEISAKEGVENSQYNLAMLYGDGLLGKSDIGKCWYWLEKSLNLGNQHARAYFSMLCSQNKFEGILRDKVLRANSYAELANMS